MAIISLAAMDLSGWRKILFIKEYYKWLLFFLKEKMDINKYGKTPDK
jgi:hypothetical protein